MSSTPGAALLPWLIGAACSAAVAAPPPSPPTAAAATPGATATDEPRIDRRVIEDDGVRIEELRVRGQPVRITVQSKVKGARPYEIHPGHGGRDASQDRGIAGTSGWRLLSF